MCRTCENGRVSDPLELCRICEHGCDRGHTRRDDSDSEVQLLLVVVVLDVSTHTTSAGAGLTVCRKTEGSLLIREHSETWVGSLLLRAMFFRIWPKNECLLRLQFHNQ